MKSQKTKQIDQIILKKYPITQEQLHNILTAPFDFQAQVMKGIMDPKNKIYPSVRIPNFGLFYVPQYIRDKQKNEEDGIISNQE